MSFLIHPDYKEENVIMERVVPNVIADIKSYVGKGKKDRADVLEYIQSLYYITNDDVCAQMDIVDAEWNAIKAERIGDVIEVLEE